jgi:hypothetical protein
VSVDPARAHVLTRSPVSAHRNGASDVHLEVEKDFTHFRFHPRGRVLADQLCREGQTGP